MKAIRQKFERFFYRNRKKGIPNLMLWIMLINGALFLIDRFDPSHMISNTLHFNRALILKGEVWRLFSFIFLDLQRNYSPLWAVVAAIFYYQMGQAAENAWGTCRFNFYYLTGWFFTVIAGMITGYANIMYVHVSLFLACATMYPDNMIRIFFIIPVKSRWLGLITIVLYLLRIFSFPLSLDNLVPLFALANYILYFGKDMVNIFPDSWRINTRRLFRKNSSSKKTIPFRPTGSYASDHASPKAPYTHKCTICGKTNVSHPGLEFRYCSRCKGYHCYCIDHINDHNHVE